MKKIELSYILTTYNKLDYLKVTLPALIKARREDEEIVVMDGGSTDGTAEYLQTLFNDQAIQFYKSEKDFGESHGFNKAMMMANGNLLKIITDDDVYSFDAIEKCKLFMLTHPDVDVMGCNGYGINLLNNPPFFEPADNADAFNHWKATKTPFIFCGLSLMIRKASLAYLGFFKTTVKMVDLEYTIRITSMKCKLAWYTGKGFVSIANEASNTHRLWKENRIEREKMLREYLGVKPLIPFKTLDAVKEIFRPFKRMLTKKNITINHIPFPEIFATSFTKLSEDQSVHEILY